MTDQEQEQYLTPEQAWRHLGVTRRTLDRYVELGRLRKYRRGITRAVFFKRSELDALLEIRAEGEER